MRIDDLALVEACLKAAELARYLELPRTEIEGRLLRAQRLANQYGTPHQQLFCAYQWAWTAFWWFEDYTEFSKLTYELNKIKEDKIN